MSEFDADEIRDFTKLKRLREAGYFQSNGSVPMPEIMADGEGPDDGWLGSSTDFGGMTIEAADRRQHQWERTAHARKYAHTNMFCTNCDRLTQHGQVATYEVTGQPVFHCNFCCKCHLCLERPNGAQRLYDAVNDIGSKLATWEGRSAADDHTFCIDCGAMLRCSVCAETGPGSYCRDCGQKIEVTGLCPSCGDGLVT